MTEEWGRNRKKPVTYAPSKLLINYIALGSHISFPVSQTFLFTVTPLFTFPGQSIQALEIPKEIFLELSRRKPGSKANPP